MVNVVTDWSIMPQQQSSVVFFSEKEDPKNKKNHAWGKPSRTAGAKNFFASYAPKYRRRGAAVRRLGRDPPRRSVADDANFLLGAADRRKARDRPVADDANAFRTTTVLQTVYKHSRLVSR